MLENKLQLPSSEVMKLHVLTSLEPYWLKGSKQVAALPIFSIEQPKIQLPLQMVWIQLPHWAQKCGIEGKLLIPQEADSGYGDWQKVDWWLVSFLLLEGWHERLWENKYGPIHSYSNRLSGWDERVWDYAWVNRIALFLRRWVAYVSHKSESDLLGPLPQPEFIITHDVDAISKALPIRIKQCVFNLFNVARLIAGGDWRQAIIRFTQAIRFMFGSENWWTLDRLIEQEKRVGIRSHFNFFSDLRRKTFMRWLFDPGYSIYTKQLSCFIRKIHDEGWVVGLHPTFDAWQDSMLISAQRMSLESLLGAEVKTCRQHWLRFSWDWTWRAQSQAGICLDTTLMFNDRPGFRAAVATSWAPWNPTAGFAHNLSVLPTLLMDSHLYDYHQMTASERRTAIHDWLGEVRTVGGKIAIVWHPHTLTDDYGWTDGFNEIVDVIRGKTEC